MLILMFSEAFHAFRRACGFYSWCRYWLLRPAWTMVGACSCTNPRSKDIVALVTHRRARSLIPRATRVLARTSAHEPCASTKCTEVLAGGHKSDCRSTAGEDQQGLRASILWLGTLGGVAHADCSVQ